METQVQHEGSGIRRYIRWQDKKYNKWGRALAIFITPLLFIGLILFTVAPGYILSRNMGAKPAFDDPLQLSVAIIFIAGGVLLYLWAIILFAKASGTQVPVVPTLKLVTKGPYAVTRNPMVTGAILILIGLSILSNAWIVFFSGMVVPGMYLLYIRLVEEEELLARFGHEYRSYKQRTPFLIPNICK